MNSSKRIVLASSTILIASLALTGCTVNIGDTGGMNGGMMENSETTSAFSGTDIMFAQMMIPHHQQAVDMSTLAETHTTNPEILALAKQIKDAQAPEIKQMSAWIESAGASLEMGHDMGMNGMLSDEQMTALGNAQGAAFDKLYLEGMIGHHEGALQMAKMIENSSNAEAKTLAANVITSQSAEIDKMKQMLAGM